jgi:hypothetical protein
LESSAGLREERVGRGWKQADSNIVRVVCLSRPHLFHAAAAAAAVVVVGSQRLRSRGHSGRSVLQPQRPDTRAV